MSDRPDAIGDAVWLVAWAMLEAKLYSGEKNGQPRAMRIDAVNSNYLMSFIGKEAGLRPFSNSSFEHMKRYASGLEWHVGEVVESKGIAAAVLVSQEMMQKYIDFDKLQSISTTVEKFSCEQIRSVLTLNSDCF